MYGIHKDMSTMTGADPGSKNRKSSKSHHAYYATHINETLSPV